VSRGRVLGTVLASGLGLGLGLAGCGGPDAAPAASTSAPAPGAAVAGARGELTMTIDGRPWAADSELFGAVHPQGYDRAVLIAGSLGPRNGQEQALNINLFGIDGPGTYTLSPGNGAAGVAQLANPAPGKFLAGGVLGYEVEVELLAFSTAPTRIEARFSGTLTANDGVVMRLQSGRFSYEEGVAP
jgi:hypothetical protein